MPDNTSAQGNAFRDSVRGLIELTPGCSSVRTEHLLGTQPVDLYYEERTSFRTLRVACECKDYERPLTKDLIARHIEPRYGPLLRKNLVDAVRIIAPLSLNATAAAYVTECGFTFHTVDQLESQIVDFRQYMRALEVAFAQDGLDRYYVRPLLEGGGDLQETVEAWIAGPTSQPVAILAGYGMGKTSFSRHLAHVLAARALAAPHNRIPILIPLSQIANEQTLEGLLGKLLAAQNLIPGYHFSVFSELNRRGRFVIILDGFDEMKHMMSWSEFQHNFTELNRLNGPNSRVLLLGRPSVLLSGDEELFVLRGKRRAGDRTYTVTGAPEYRQITMREFSSQQAIEFMRAYATFRAATDTALRGGEPANIDLEARIRSIQNDPEMMGLIVRPVQARMLADLAIDPEVQWRSFSRYELYQEFIGRITEREARKPARTRLNVQARRRFIRRVAWWVWGGAGAAGFDIADLPETLLEDLQDDVQASIEGIRRDLVSGSILEKKTADTYYFPHRSFLEFLVAEYLCFEQPTQDDLDYFSYSQTAEVRDFIKDSPHAKKIAQWAAHIDSGMEMALGWLELVAWLRNLNGDPLELNPFPHMTPRQLLVDYLRIVECGAMLDASDYLVDAFRVAKNRQTRIACLVGLLLAQTRDRSSSQRRVLRKQVVALLLSRCLKQFERLSDPDRQPHTVDGDPFVRMVLTAVTSYESTETELVLSVDFPALNRLILQAASQLGIRELSSRLRWDWERDGRVEVFALSELANVNSRLAADKRGAHVVRFFTRYPKPRVLLPRDLWSLLD